MPDTPMTQADTLRSRFLPAWRGRDGAHADLETMFENVLSMMASPRVKQAALEKGGTLNAVGIAQALREELGKEVVPTLRRTRQDIDEQSASLVQQRAALAKPKLDTADIPAAMRRQEMRTVLRGLSDLDRLKVLTNNPDPLLVEAALEDGVPSIASGLTADTRSRVEHTYVQANFADRLQRIDERDEALAVVRAAVQLAVTEIRTHVRFPEGYPHLGEEFDTWFATAGREPEKPQLLFDDTGRAWWKAA